MLEVVFSDSAAGTMAVAIGHKGFLGGATSVIISDGTVSKEEIEKFQHQAEERERSDWENAIPLEGNRKDIVNLPLALSVGNISEAGICLERESALSLLLSILPDMASEIVTELLNTSRKNYATLLEKAQNGEPIRVWVGRDPDDVCGLYWLLEQLRPIGFEKLDITIVELPMWETRPDGCIVQYNGWGEVEPYHLGRMASLGKKLPTNYLRSLANRWRELQQENSPLRAVINGKLVSVSETLYDTFILRELDALDDEFRESVLVGQVLGKNQLGISDGWIALRVEQFILLRCLDCLLPLLIELVDTLVLYTVCRIRNPVSSILSGRVFISVVSLFCPFLYPHIGRLHTLTGYGGFIYGLYCAFDRISGFYISHRKPPFPEDLRSNQPTFFATTTSLPFCAEYSQVERVMSLSPYSAVTPVSYKASSLHFPT